MSAGCSVSIGNDSDFEGGFCSALCGSSGIEDRGEGEAGLPSHRPTATTTPPYHRAYIAWRNAEFLALKHESMILGHSSNPVCGFSMMEQVRLCAVRPMENWLGSSLNHIVSGVNL